jgi:transcription factor E
MAVKNENLNLMLKELIRKIAGKTSEPIVDILYGKENVNEFKIAEKLKITINQTRNILYRISSQGVLESTRKKDKRKGWYTYFWTLNLVKALEILIKLKDKEKQIFDQILKSHETKQFYTCKQDNIEMSEETAMHHGYMCPECGQLLEIIAKDKKVKEISSKIDFLNKEMSNINMELEKIRPKPRPIIKKEKKAKKKISKKQAKGAKIIKKKPSKKFNKVNKKKKR